MSPVVLTLAAAICLASQISASAEKPPATTPAPDLCLLPPYDVAKLQGRDYWFANISGQPSACIDGGNCTYYMAFCHQLRLNVQTANCNGSAVCQVGYQGAKKKQFSYSMGMYELDEVQFHQSHNTPTGGFYMDVSGGNNVSRCNSTAGLSTRVIFECNESAVWTSQNLTNFTSVLAYECDFEITLQYSGACNRATTPTPTRSSSSTTNGHMTHTSTRNFTTTHSPHNMTSTSKHTTANMTTHSMPSTAEHSSTKHTGSSTTSNHVSPTKSSTPTRTHSSSSHSKPTTTPITSPTPPPHPTHPHTKPHTTKPTENPLQHKVTGLTAGVVIFALLSFILLILVIGAMYFVYKRGGGKYRRVDINDE